MSTLFEPPEKRVKDVSSQSAGDKRLGPLTCFAINPTGVRFETQQDDEAVVLFLRQHPIVNLPWILLSIVLLIGPTVALPFFLKFANLPVRLPPQYMLIATLLWYLATFGFIFGNFLRWFFNIYIVTDRRIVDIDFYYLLFKRFSEAEVSKIQDISFTVGGIAATVFDYGNVLIETAGELPNLKFEAVPHPEKVVETIRSLEPKIGGGAP
ncbi:hypothetical protein HY086_00560 [Candidatus Gottesmanbacteria bacterium]|nr:hypothetical protein [Candidatus Gottesmanbacteria bacterium]